METWYLMFDGTSADGRGHGEYFGRTLDKNKAKKHFKKCKKDPYSTGSVHVLTEDEFYLAMSEDEFN